MPNAEEDDLAGPEFEVWNHLDSGLELARNELDVLDPATRKSVEKFAEMVVGARRTFALRNDQRIWVELYELLLEYPWYRHAAEIELGWEGIHRAAESLRRFMQLRPVLTSYRVTERASQYLQEVIDTFLFGFDSACIALSGATLEQLLRDVALSSELVTEGQLKREQPTGLGLLERLKRAGVLLDCYDAAKRVLDERNRIMHRRPADSSALEGLALQSIVDLGRVLVTAGEVEGR